MYVKGTAQLCPDLPKSKMADAVCQSQSAFWLAT